MALETSIASFHFQSGPLRGTQLSLFATRLLHQGDGQMESISLGAIAAASVGYARDARRLAWGAALAVLALILILVSGPLAGVAAEAAAEINGSNAVAHLLQGTLLALGGLASVLPAVGAGCLIGGAALAAFGWIGTTTLALSFAAGERAYGVRGRNRLLVDFAELVAERVAQSGR